jgi:maltose O-acetyltransferase
LTEKEKMLRGDLYYSEDAELVRDRAVSEGLMREFNAGHAVLGRLLGGLGSQAMVRAPFYCDYGYNIFLGERVFLNFGCVLLDVCRIEIGDGTQIGPGVQIYAADHPRDAATRALGLENGLPVSIGREVWIGGGAIILPGVTVGDGAVIGAGSVVTRDVAAGATVMGNPARTKEKR